MLVDGLILPLSIKLKEITQRKRSTVLCVQVQPCCDFALVLWLIVGIKSGQKKI